MIDKIYGVFDKSIDKFVIVYTYHRMKDFGSKYSDPKYIHIELLGPYPEAHSWNGTTVVYDSNYVKPIQKKYLIYSLLPDNTPFTNPYIPPLDIDYKVNLMTNLHAKRNFVQGELVNVVWYKTYDDAEPVEADKYKEPVLDVTVSYVRDTLGFAQYRTTTRKWYFEDGTIDDNNVKVTGKYYDKVRTIAEGKVRRKNIIDALTLPTFEYLIATELSDPNSVFASQQDLIVEGRRFLASHKAEFNNFIDDSNPQILTDITNDTTSWLDNEISPGQTIRDYLLTELNIQVVI